LRSAVGDGSGLGGGWRCGQRDLDLMRCREHLLDTADDVEGRRRQGVGHPLLQRREVRTAPDRCLRQHRDRGVGAVVE
jgi:hypothetical protein